MYKKLDGVQVEVLESIDLSRHDREFIKRATELGGLFKIKDKEGRVYTAYGYELTD